MIAFPEIYNPIVHPGYKVSTDKSDHERIRERLLRLIRWWEGIVKVRTWDSKFDNSSRTESIIIASPILLPDSDGSISVMDRCRASGEATLLLGTACPFANSELS